MRAIFDLHPTFDNFAVGEQIDSDPVQGDGQSTRRQVEELMLVCTAQCVAPHNLVPIRQQIVQGRYQIRERGPV